MIVFIFHGLGTPGSHVPQDEVAYWCERDLFLRLLDAIREISAQGRVPVEITFDDGNASDLEIALPALKERDLTAAFFVCAGRLDTPGYLAPQDLAAMQDAGMAIGSHGVDHVNLRGCSDADLQNEAEGSRAALSACLPRPVDSFAIPFGSYDRRVLKSLQGYRKVYNSDHLWARRGQQWLTPRFSYVTGWTADRPQVIADAQPGVVAALSSGLKTRLKAWR